MKKRILLICVVLVFAFSLAACNELTSLLGGGDVTGQVGKTYKTQWFNFTVKSIEIVDSYADYKPKEGNVLVDVVVKEVSTFSSPIPMGTFDFYFDHNSFAEYVWPMDPLNDTMMPEEFSLVKGETVEYHMVFELPKGYADLSLMYTEYDEQENIGVTFSIPFSTIK